SGPDLLFPGRLQERSGSPASLGILGLNGTLESGHRGALPRSSDRTLEVLSKLLDHSVGDFLAVGSKFVLHRVITVRDFVPLLINIALRLLELFVQPESLVFDNAACPLPPRLIFLAQAILPLVQLLQRAHVFPVVFNNALGQLAAFNANQEVEQPTALFQMPEGLTI